MMSALPFCIREGGTSGFIPKTAHLAIVLAWSILGQVLTPMGARAVPYATCLTNQSGAISFRLNEPAEQVWLVSDNGALTNQLGALAAGLHTFALEITGPFQVAVAKVSPPGYLTPIHPNQAAVLQINTNSVFTRFTSPRGLAVNTDPTSPAFGRIYVANSASGPVTNVLFGPGRNTGDGLYALNADLSDALGQGDLALSGGLNFMTNSDRAPYRLTIGTDQQLYVSDFGEATGSLYVVDPDITPGSGNDVLNGPAGGRFPVGLTRIHGSIAAAQVLGSSANGDLQVYVIDEDMQTDPTSDGRFMLNSVWLHEPLLGPQRNPTLIVQAPWFNLASQVMDLNRATNSGRFYVTDYRAGGADRAGLYVEDPSGISVWNSLEQTRRLLADPNAIDLLVGTGGTALSVDEQLVAVMNQDNNLITVLRLFESLPDLSSRLAFNGFGTTNGSACDLAFDAAGNLYAISGGAQCLRVFSPGGATTAVTGSDGTFQILRPPAVSVTATDAPADEPGLASGLFTFHRTGDTNNEIVLTFALSGNALMGVDYAPLPPTVVLPAGVTEVNLEVLPLQDTLTEPVEDVRLELLGSASYDLSTPSSATVWIQDDEPATVTVSATKDFAYERFPQDWLRFEIARTGDTNSALAVAYDLTTGTAVAGRDFQGTNGQALPSAINFDPGQIREVLMLEPIDDLEFEGTETVVLRLLPRSSYAIGATAAAEGRIIDSEPPPLPRDSVIFAENFETNSSARWQTRFGANNGIYDAIVIWNHDYATLGIPPAPNSAPGTTSGLFVQVNKTNATTAGSAGINFYPRTATFRGNFGLRFDLLLHLGTSSPTEHAVAGINHSGLLTNRVTQSFDPSETTRGGDGLWVALSSNDVDEGGCAAYTVPFVGALPRLITNRPPDSMTEIFPAPPYAIAGAPGSDPLGTPNWTEVELSLINHVFSLSFNNRLIYSFTNATAFTNGTIMIGLNDQFDSVGSGGFDGNYAIFDNVRVVSYEHAITGVALLSGQVVINFISPAGGEPQDFHVQSSPGLKPTTWQPEPTAIITRNSPGFRAVVPRRAGSQYYYRLVR